MIKDDYRLTAHERAQLTQDISEALREMFEHPERAANALRILNNRIRPLGFRLEYAARARDAEGSQSANGRGDMILHAF